MSSNSDDGDYQDENELCKYGQALPQYEADEIPSKKPLQIEDQVVRDENGIRRFHGAFTGGFSAGYWNTVGSKEGFTPREFKSSRGEKAAVKSTLPTDYMDEEDFSEFGIAPQKIKPKEDFATSSSSQNSSNKRKREKPSQGPIPGEPVLSNLLKPVHDKAAVRILKKMGWRDNQGIGSRMTYNEKKKANERNLREKYIAEKYSEQSRDSDEDLSDEEITFAPDDFDPYIANIKDNTFGLGYSGLQKTSLSEKQHINLFAPFQVVGKNNKKFSISGQAFGVGALEEDDADIYQNDDMSNYDRTLDPEGNKRKKPEITKSYDASIVEGFSRASINDCQVRVFRVDIPRDFTPRNWFMRKSRFAPIDKERAKALESQNKHKTLGLGRHDLVPAERGAILGEASKKSNVEEAKTPPIQKSSTAAKKISNLLSSKQFVSENNEKFKPFMGNAEKQERYDKFLALKSSDEQLIDKLLNDIQPLSMSAFDREMEKKEFIQAKRMYQPLDALMANRFIKEADVQKEQQVVKKIVNGKEQIVVQRTKVMWKPHKDLCKRFNVPEPYGGLMYDEEEDKKKKKQSSSLFDFIGVPLNTKANFVTPQIIPRKVTEDNRKSSEDDERRKEFLAAVEKEKSFMNTNESKRAAAKDFFDINEPSTSTAKKVQEKRVPEQPKTDLEIKVAESINKKPEEKKDLFQAIFCESDEEEEDEQQENNEPEAILTEKQKSTFVESFLNTKSASQINVLRNASPPRGIFKNILEMSSIKEKQKEHELPPTESNSIDDGEEVYGPKLPTIPLTTSAQARDDSNESSSDSSVDKKILKKLKKAKESSRERWVEKDKVKKMKKHHKKKSSHKKSHKKHKSKK